MHSTRVAVLGAGGFVSQRMQQRLANHPWFELVAVAGQDTVWLVKLPGTDPGNPCVVTKFP